MTLQWLFLIGGCRWNNGVTCVFLSELSIFQRYLFEKLLEEGMMKKIKYRITISVIYHLKTCQRTFIKYPTLSFPEKIKSQIKAQITSNVKTTCRSFHCFHISIYHIQKIDFNGIINWRWNYLEDFSIAMLQCHLLIINIQLLRYMAYCSLRNWRFLIV